MGTFGPQDGPAVTAENRLAMREIGGHPVGPTD
jgi:hypothetical protein